MHRSVGVIIKNENDQILMHKRASYPFGWAMAAGHIEDNETPEQAIAREVKEETNLKILEYKLLYHEFIPWNDCKYGAKGHDWYLYEAIKWDGEVKHNEEAKEMKWVKTSDIKNLKLEPIWEYWFKKLKLLPE